MKEKVPEIFPLHDIPLLPEKRLLYAILWRVFKDLFYSTKLDKRNAMAYIRSKKTEKTQWSFRWLCHELDLKPELIRKHIIDYQNKLDKSHLKKMLEYR